MSQPPYGPDPDRPQDTPRSFPTYARPDDDSTQPLPTSDPTVPLPVQPGTGQPGTGYPGSTPPTYPRPHDTPPTQPLPTQSGWAAPGQPVGSTPQVSPYGQSQPGYGQQPPAAPYGQQPVYGGQPPAQPPYGLPVYGQPPYGHPAYPAAYGYGYPGGGRKTNGFAIAALACGLGGLATGISAPFGVGFGIAALVQLKRRPNEDGKGMAIAGLITGGLLTLFFAALIVGLIALGTWADDQDYGASDPGSSSSSSGTYVEDLAIGECFNGDDPQDEVTRQDCANAHDGEIISNPTLPDGPYPGDRQVDRTGQSRCATDFRTYVGKSVDDSELTLGWTVPDEESWEDDHDRLVVCAAYAPEDERVTGTVKGTKR
ncbi:DUF4190 domain-containing protein [Kribbella sp. NPDC005582]|uniref:DUF4190 domain-containing protein n=1 Tax=Kribbella sp. NPDC005582 TaxID=3156893 RepID=UPI0033AA899D